LAEWGWEGRPERASLRRAIRHQLRRLDPTIRVIAESYLAQSTPIDLLAVGGEGEIISIRIGSSDFASGTSQASSTPVPCGSSDAALLTQSLADLSWLRPRLGDFLKLAPGLGIEPSAEPRAMLCCDRFSGETRAAVENFPSRQIELLTYHCLRQRGQLAVLFESWVGLGNQATHAYGDPNPGFQSRGSPRGSPLAGAPSPSKFRTGLTTADLCNDLEEEKILD
jgi:hypothetical protein